MRYFFFIFIFISNYSFSDEYYWGLKGSGPFFSNPTSACQSLNGQPWGQYVGQYLEFNNIESTSNPEIFNCLGKFHKSYGVPDSGIIGFATRYGTDCPENSIYDTSNGVCIPEPTCPDFGSSKLVSVTCDCTGPTCIAPSLVSIDGCGFNNSLLVTGNTPVPSQNIKNYDNPSDSICIQQMASTGDAQAPSETVEEVCPTCSKDIATDSETCVTSGFHTFCTDNEQPNCGTRDGQPYCYTETDTCGTFNNQHVCIPDSGSRTCSYVKGSYECVDKTTGEKISYDSPDHPDNGGNADGNPNNDAQAPGSVVTGGSGVAQSGDSAATNKAITDLQGVLSDKLDGISDLLGEGESAVTNVTAPTSQGSLGSDEWDVKITDAKAELKASAQGVAAHITAANSWIINGGVGSLSCFVEEWGRVCLDDYSSQLIGIRYVLIFMAYVLAVYIIFIRD